ncbi:MAG: hypothetical protein P0Y53_23150 [Candidatus Pseudobacter hemicellulosilyticus]|uniref:Uncharacterized protein n=1 Tax=Candidatus Pseudobacter hemicellulosilyticus TaxID=3121375 RepID=A0AAJ5WW02_9BACT|nr:MAG: hypothetical protein P0Y53_23150 [Pseudobacter sp.]
MANGKAAGIAGPKGRELAMKTRLASLKGIIFCKSVYYIFRVIEVMERAGNWLQKPSASVWQKISIP